MAKKKVVEYEPGKYRTEIYEETTATPERPNGYRTPAERAAMMRAANEAANSPAAQAAKAQEAAIAQAEANKAAAMTPANPNGEYRSPAERAAMMKNAPSSTTMYNPNEIGAVDPIYQTTAGTAAGKAAAGSGAGATTGTKQITTDEVLNKILNGDGFRYNLAADPTFQQLAAAARKEAKLEKADTLAHQTAMTGGYGNTWAQVAAERAYDARMQQLYDQVPALEAAAYDRYRDERADLKDQYSILAAREAAEKEEEWRNKEWDLQLERYRVADEQWAKEFGLNVDEFMQKKYEFQESLKLQWADMDLKEKEFALEKWYKEQGIELSKAELQETIRQFNAEMGYKYYAQDQDNAYKYAALAQDDEQFYANLYNKTSGNSPSGNTATEKTLMSYFDNDQDAVNAVVRDVAGMMTNPAQWSTDRIFAYLEANYGEEIGARIYSLARTKLGMTN